ncbi:MAG: lysophospholipid acyltransferase family protein [Rickettsiales bacterium]|nr:lysophospholipid acyltransferase family protein [Pseudomonadota bacterium]MDA0967018.1 lysophospholipid acyltransferase family protein [Pseudomonadota bacterium]MDG4543938.1 lysophospholipid acyltransferase family protein [Rickettsiales bacterium]MDG4546084.1 lysophospholipid acyltransferase family protein [Rickettsiales bacterium]MDG4548330.1 lysophospholipid acyltransferase family protein [Rickettsiales bacterium]
MRPGKKILKSKAFHVFICWLAHKYIWFVYLTSRWEVRGAEHRIKLEEQKQQCIFAFWHGRLLMIPPFAPKVAKIHVLISNHNDGELIARTMTHFGFGLVRGSTGKEGLTALRNILKIFKKGENLAITPDGPKGPRMRVSGTVIDIAKMSGLPIIPLTFCASKCKVLRSWDRFIAAKPFSKGCFIYGEPLYVKKDANEEELKKAGIELENRLNKITEEADMAVGIEPVLPCEDVKEKR